MIKIISPHEYKRITRNISADISSAVSRILQDVKENGDEAVRKYEREFDKAEISELRISDDEIAEALREVSTEYSAMLQRTAENIRAFHVQQLPKGFTYSPNEGIMLGQRIIPIKHAGIYVPGGSASYPSTVLMNAIPANVAGCEEIYIATPPPVSPNIIAAAHIAGVTAIFRMGGAQAIGAFAFGTKSVPKVDKITGPGNIYVAEAKRQVFGETGIDIIAGPSEILIIADNNNNPSYIAADMLAQAEHDINASAILITTSKNLAGKVRNEIERQILTLTRQSTARKSIDNNSSIIIVQSLLDAVDLANDIAPEHLQLCITEPFSWLDEIRNAGTVFIGQFSPEAAGDYVAGTNHTLPTMGTARFASPLSVNDFLKSSQFVYYDKDALYEVAEDIQMFAMSEGLQAHANSIKIRSV